MRSQEDRDEQTILIASRLLIAALAVAVTVVVVVVLDRML